MHSLVVWRELDFRFERVGAIDVFDDPMEPPRFRYDGDYLAKPTARPISASLPLRGEYYDEQLTDAFFDGLLSEGDLRSRVSTALEIDASDTTGLLGALNYDTIGALVFTDGMEPDYRSAGFKNLSPSDLGALAFDVANRLPEYAQRSHVSLSGFMNKIGLVRDVDTWMLPMGLAPSTWIVKFSDPTLGDDIVNEALCLSLAQNLGLPTAEYRVLSTRGQGFAICLKRFDRTTPSERVEGIGTPIAGRLHQEDFCQAMGFSAALKYERDGHGYFGRCVRLIQKASANPARDLGLFLDNIIVDYLLGNCDNHLKNYSLVYAPDWRTCRMAPAYDKICTVRYGQYRDNMAIPLGDDTARRALSRSGVETCLKSAGVPMRLFERHLVSMTGRIDDALSQAVKQVSGLGLDVPPVLPETIAACAADVRAALL